MPCQWCEGKGKASLDIDMYGSVNNSNKAIHNSLIHNSLAALFFFFS